jgi:sortase A
MIRARPRRRFFLVPILSLGSLVLGIGCVSWALVNIRAQAVPSDGRTTVAAEQITPTGGRVVATRSVDPTGAVGPGEDLYPEYPKKGARIGSLTIPVLKQTLPIIEGTAEDDLKKGVGHYAQSVLPGEKDNCVLSGHRDTVFARLGKLKVGDRLIARTSAGTFTYRITRIRIVHKDDRTVIVPTDHAVLTLSTCYPFRFVGSAPDRYVLIADMEPRPQSRAR